MKATTFDQEVDLKRGPRLGGPPVLPIRYITVRARNGALVYSADDVPIPGDDWVRVPLSAGIVQAIKYGDLEQGEPAGEHAAAQHRHRRRPAEAE